MLSEYIHVGWGFVRFGSAVQSQPMWLANRFSSIFYFESEKRRVYWCIVLGKVPNRVYGTSWIWNTKTEALKGFSLLAQMGFHYLCMSLILDLMTWYSFMCTWLIWQPFELSKDLMEVWARKIRRATANEMNSDKKELNKTIKTINELKKAEERYGTHQQYDFSKHKFH